MGGSLSAKVSGIQTGVQTLLSASARTKGDGTRDKASTRCPGENRGAVYDVSKEIIPCSEMAKKLAASHEKSISD